MARNTYEDDLRASWVKQQELLKQQVLLEVIKIAADCKTYDEFRNALFGIALGWVKEAEADGLVKSGTSKQAAENVAKRQEADKAEEDSNILL